MIVNSIALAASVEATAKEIAAAASVYQRMPQHRDSLTAAMIGLQERLQYEWKAFILKVAKEVDHAQSDWEKQFGAKRRRADRKLLAELERSLPAEVVPLRPPAGLEEPERAQTAKNSQGPSAASCEAPEPDIDFDNEAAKRIAAAFGRKIR